MDNEKVNCTENIEKVEEINFFEENKKIDFSEYRTSEE